MAKYYYGSKISNNIGMLDNGCMICYNVPIARTGTYKYLKEELGLEGSGIVDVFRTDDQVFAKETIASFEGKAFTDTHPPVDVTADNWYQYSKGELTNVRRGTGEQSNMLIADILVRDPITIDKIKTGSVREISAGYDCCYIEKDAKVYQQDIRGNHAALVQSGRAGSSVRINDEKKDVLTPKYKFIKKVEQAIKIIDI